MTALQDDLAKLVPNARYAVAIQSGHNIHQDQPELGIAAIRDVVDALRNPSTWTPAVASPAKVTPGGHDESGNPYLATECTDVRHSLLPSPVG